MAGFLYLSPGVWKGREWRGSGWTNSILLHVLQDTPMVPIQGRILSARKKSRAWSRVPGIILDSTWYIVKV